MISSIRMTVIGIALAVFMPTVLAAADLPAPTGDPLLVVSGNIARTNTGDTASFDAEMLSELGGVKIATTTIWTDGVQDFTGVSLKALLDAVGVTGGTLMATAVNDYAVEIPVSDAVEGGPIVAYANGGAPMSVRDKGPLWIIYPYDSDTAYQSEVIYSRSIWQLDRIVVVE